MSRHLRRFTPKSPATDALKRDTISRWLLLSLRDSWTIRCEDYNYSRQTIRVKGLPARAGRARSVGVPCGQSASGRAGSPGERLVHRAVAPPAPPPAPTQFAGNPSCSRNYVRDSHALKREICVCTSWEGDSCSCKVHTDTHRQGSGFTSVWKITERHVFICSLFERWTYSHSSEMNPSGKVIFFQMLIGQ